MKDSDMVAMIESVARTRHGARSDLLQKVIAERVRLRTITGLRRTIPSPEHRFFLAFLMYAQSRNDVLTLIGARFGARDANRKLTKWIIELSDHLLDPGSAYHAIPQNVREYTLSALLEGKAFEEIPAIG